MKILLTAIALLAGSNVAAIAAEQTLKFQLQRFSRSKGRRNSLCGDNHLAGRQLGTKLFDQRVKMARPRDTALTISPKAPSW